VSAKQYAKVIIDLVNDGVDKPFDYLLPPELQGQVQIGSQVTVPFRSGTVRAFVVSLQEKTSVKNVKEVLKVENSSARLSQELVHLSYWVSRYFFTRWIEVIRLCLPPGRNRIKPKYEEIVFSQQANSFLLEESKRLKNKAFRQSLILEYVARAKEGIAWDILRKETNASRQSLVALVKKGLLQIDKSPKVRLPWEEKMFETDMRPDLVLTGQQEKAWQEILQGLEGPQKHFLIHGITGSGKTELYFRAAEKVLSRGQTVLILIPEIALTPVLINQFRGRFAGQFALLHSSLSPGERYDMWWKVKKGEARIVLGARSAVFAPLENIGLIVIDEEHENAYKQEETPRYHARDVAWQRAVYHGALLLMGSATPSLDSYLKVQQKELKLVEIFERVEGRVLPSVQIVDMRKEFKQKNRSIFSRALLSAIKETLEEGDQLILFLNRRGFAGFQLCRVCGFVMRCPNCSVSLTYHTSPEHLQCHICGYRRDATGTCPECHSPYLRSFGLGTQKVEKEMAALFPGIKIIRMDSDATAAKGAHYRMWKAFNEKKAQVLIGTQMVAKGLDFPGVTLVGVIAADVTLHLPDFRAGERTFQLLSQVAGRAGRGEKKGRVLIQTYTPWHYSIERAASHDYKGFIAEEAKRRELLTYPPFAEMLLFCCSSQDEEKAGYYARELKKVLQAGLLNDQGEFLLSEPFPAPLQKKEGYFRYHIVYKGNDLHRFAREIREIVWDFRKKLQEDMRVTVDFNPLMML
jgi:primosomal protein N' (replication factor Y)